MAITWDEISPSVEALARARALALEAAREDGWMEPCPEDHAEDAGDLGSLSQSHREGWETTEHFEELYGRRLSDMTDTEEERISGSVGGLNHIELGRYEGLYVPLRDAFWDAWEDATDFYPKAQKALDDVAARDRRRGR